jgi:hypothetical protein
MICTVFIYIKKNRCAPKINCTVAPPAVIKDGNRYPKSDGFLRY